MNPPCSFLGPTLAALWLLVPSLGAWQGEGELTDEELVEVDRLLRRGEILDVRELCDEVLEEVPTDADAAALRAGVRFLVCDYAGVRVDLATALEHAREDERPRIVRRAAQLFLELGLGDEVVELIDPDSTDARDAWWRSRALLAVGRREEALAAARVATEAAGGETWDVLLAAARAERFLGEFRRAARTLVRADGLAREADGTEPEILVELGDLYFEAYGEVEDPQSRAHSPAELFREALELAPAYEPALLGLYDLHRKNWLRQSRSAADILDEILTARPDSIPALLRRVAAALDDGDLPRARATITRLEELAPARRELAAERATLSWIEHRRDDALAELAALTESDPGDGRPERTVGKHLLELYRFAEGLEFLERSVERDPSDWIAWTELGRARANTGDEAGGLEALEKAKETAQGRQDAWRTNMHLVLSRIQDRFLEVDGDELSFAWEADADEVLRTYLVPFYEEARVELAERYGFTPDPVRIEVFRRWGDFSVRSTGFEGFPALGVCSVRS